MKSIRFLQNAGGWIRDHLISPINLKLALRALSCALIICGIFSLTGLCISCRDIESKLLRFHILAHSDSDEDQQLKLHVRDAILQYSDRWFADCQSKEEAVAAARSHLAEIRSKAQETVRKAGYDYPVEAYVTNMSFDTRVYEDFTLPAGHYDAVRIVIGSGQGHNWWCVLYPAVCVPSAEKKIGSALTKNETDLVTHHDQYIVSFRLIEWLNDIFG